MLYTKKPLTYEEQADQLLRRGLATDRGILIERLSAVNYYRLSGYLYPFRNTDDTFRKGTTLDIIWRRYTFDRRLRVHVMDAIERIEVSARTKQVYEHAHAFGSFGYTTPANLPNLDHQSFGRFLSGIDNETSRSKETFISHFQQRYGDQHGWPPLWMATELMTLGTTLTLYRGAPDSVKKEVVRQYAQPEEVFESWLRALHAVRNICAHHARLWNRVLGVSPRIPRKNKNPDWHIPVQFSNNRIFAILTILKYLHDCTAPQSKWPQRMRELLDEYPDIPKADMGFPVNWEDCPIWKP
jgi:abortive infection bacteriophage resistance protein